jgi:hypothetical protein
MFRKIRIWLWYIISDLEQKLYPFEKEDRNDYYYMIKNPDTGEEYMIIEWLKSFDQKIDRLQDEMIWVKSEINQLHTLHNT